MNIEKLYDFIDQEDKRLLKHYGIRDKQKIILARTVKLMEELGELCDDVLSHTTLQRTAKLKKLNKENIKKEFADVIFTTLLLAKVMNIDVGDAIEKRIKSIQKRTY